MLSAGRALHRPESTPYVTYVLMATNIVVYFCTFWRLVDKYRQPTPFLLAYGQSNGNFHWEQLLTATFLHSGLWHLVGNMVALYIFGTLVEGRMRTARYLWLYFITGLVGSISHLLIVGRLHPDVPALGASGCISGVIGAAMFMFPRARVELIMPRDPTLGNKIEIFWLGLLYLLYDGLFMGLPAMLGTSPRTGAMAHIGGMVSGFVIAWLMGMRRDSEAVSRAKEAILYTQDYTMLTEKELCDLYSVQPDRSDIALHLANSSLHGMGFGLQYATESFNTHKAKIIEQGEIMMTCKVALAFIERQPDFFTPTELRKLALRGEECHQYLSALQLYRHLLDDPIATSNDRENASYRIASVYDKVLNDHESARIWYEYVVQNFPMSPCAIQVKARLQILTSQ